MCDPSFTLNFCFFLHIIFFSFSLFICPTRKVLPGTSTFRDNFKLLKNFRITRAYYSGEGYSYPKSILVEFNLLQVGIIRAIDGSKVIKPNLNLAVSLHAPVQDIHCQIMPAARTFPLEKLMDALEDLLKEQVKI